MAPRKMLRQVMSTADIYAHAETLIDLLRDHYGSYDADALDEVLVEESFVARLRAKGYDLAGEDGEAEERARLGSPAQRELARPDPSTIAPRRPASSGEDSLPPRRREPAPGTETGVPLRRSGEAETGAPVRRRGTNGESEGFVPLRRPEAPASGDGSGTLRRREPASNTRGALPLRRRDATNGGQSATPLRRRAATAFGEGGVPLRPRPMARDTMDDLPPARQVDTTPPLRDDDTTPLDAGADQDMPVEGAMMDDEAAESA